MANESPPIPTDNDSAYVTREAAADYLFSRYGYGTTKWLAKLAVVGGGPVFYRSGGRMALYRLADIDIWAIGRMSGPITKTSEEAA